VSLELHPGLYQGALIECGVIDGIGNADFYLAARAVADTSAVLTSSRRRTGKPLSVG